MQAQVGFLCCAKRERAYENNLRKYKERGEGSLAKIMVFVPRADMIEQFQNVLDRVEVFENIQIELVHVFGTPKSLSENRDADILVARGMTYEHLKSFFPQKHIIQIQMTSYDILNALIHCKEQFHPKKIGLCLHNIDISSLTDLEQLCGAKNDLYDVTDEESAKKALDVGVERGTEVYVGAGTVCGVCDQRGLNRVHIKTKDEAIEMALKSALNTARTINRERMSYSMFKMIINSSTDGIITIDDEGMIQQINNQAYKMFHLSTVDDIKGHPIRIVDKHFKWKQALEEGGSREEVLKTEDGGHYFIQYTPITVDERNTGLVIIIKNSEQILKEENKIRHSISEKGLVAKYTFDNILGKSKKIEDNIRMAKCYSKVDSNVLIIGETGTGKELFAHSIHQASNRRKEPFVALNCAALPENLLESELFGYEAGAFSGASKNGKIGLFELAHRGTIFLDEIGEIPITLQAKLLRVLQEKEIRRIGGNRVQPIDVRVISATNVNIEKQIEEGKFRSDLYYRLNLLDIYIPPLRERKEDIQEMVDFYLNKFSCEMKKSPAKLTPGAAKMLTEYSWPGNVRELRNICERLVVLNDSDQITPDDLWQFKVFSRMKIRPDVKEVQNQEEERTIRVKPKKTKEDIAKELGISRTTLWRMSKQKKKSEEE